MHPDTRVEIFWTSPAGVKTTVVTTVEAFKECIINIFESTLVDNVDNVYYTVNNETRELDYYNAEL